MEAPRPKRRFRSLIIGFVVGAIGWAALAAAAADRMQHCVDLWNDSELPDVLSSTTGWEEEAQITFWGRYETNMRERGCQVMIASSDGSVLRAGFHLEGSNQADWWQVEEPGWAATGQRGWDHPTHHALAIGPDGKLSR